MNAEQSICTARHLNHVCIAVRDIDASLAFYRELFGVGEHAHHALAALARLDAARHAGRERLAHGAVRARVPHLQVAL